MIVTTSDVIPDNMQILRYLGTVTYTYRVKVEQRGTADMVIDGRKENGLDGLEAQASRVQDANCVFGLRMSSTAATSPEGTFIYHTYHASVARVRTLSTA